MASVSVSSSAITASLAEKISWYCALFLAALLVLSCCDSSDTELPTRGYQKLMNRPCDEIYVVEEGETLNTISEKCGDPFIVEENPHIHDPDDVFPGLVIKITPFIVRESDKLQEPPSSPKLQQDVHKIWPGNAKPNSQGLIAAFTFYGQMP
ncbi:hypothetical protein HHK36_016776 [Tetracentron sinense]|uniref:LysM domain-containing protein n=1 Tax=Tetracentron sinense TaxID=13715 RepID=A0A834Z5W6_TETSI|nr:hypothetical protein HHK36_016776 [Tetracentron sinense]